MGHLNHNTSPPNSDPNGPIPISIFVVIYRGDGAPHWHPARDSNPHYDVRSVACYPLHKQGIWSE